MNQAHKDCIELLKIVHDLCLKEKLSYSIAADTAISYANNMAFEDCVPVIYITLLYDDFLSLKTKLMEYCQKNSGFSYHDYLNTSQFDSFEAWFVKMPRFSLSAERQNDELYYGTRLVITPLFYAGNSHEEWNESYRYFNSTVYTVNSRAVLKGKPLRSYIKLTPIRTCVNHYIKQRGKYSIEKCIEKYGSRDVSNLLVYPHIVDRDYKNINSMARMVSEKSGFLNLKEFRETKLIELWGQETYCIAKPHIIEDMFPDYAVKDVLNTKKSQLLLNGNTYLWRVQQIQIELLVEFDRICRKNNLKYNISFGTLLGAIRHKGFIPWDDDIDVTMPLEDYNKLDQVINEDIDAEKYYFRNPDNEPNNHLIFKHLERRGTTYTKPGRDKLSREIGVFIDIFPMYPSAHFLVSDWIHAKICRYWRTSLWATVGADSEKDEKLRRKYKRMAAPGNRVCYEKFVKAATFFKNKKYLKFWIAMDRNPYKTPLVKMQNYTDAVDVEFEGHKFLAAKDYEDVLKYCFGDDWRMYPPIRGRQAAHNAIMDIGDLYFKESEGML